MKLLMTLLPLLSAMTVMPKQAETDIKPVPLVDTVIERSDVSVDCGFFLKDADIKYEVTDVDLNQKPAKPPVKPSIQPRDIKIDSNNADARYEEMKNQLNANFSKMFELKKELDSMQASMSSKWEEYYALQNTYNKELKKLIANWVTDTLY